jgi:hypothetical protein
MVVEACQDEWKAGWRYHLKGYYKSSVYEDLEQKNANKREKGQNGNIFRR